MKAILTIIGSAIAGGVILLRWWLSPDKIKERVFKSDKKQKHKFRAKMRFDRSAARDMFKDRLQENRFRRRR